MTASRKIEHISAKARPSLLDTHALVPGTLDFPRTQACHLSNTFEIISTSQKCAITPRDGGPIQLPRDYVKGRASRAGPFTSPATAQPTPNPPLSSLPIWPGLLARAGSRPDARAPQTRPHPGVLLSRDVVRCVCGVASCPSSPCRANQNRVSADGQTSRWNDRANSERLFGRSGPISRRSCSRSLQGYPSAGRNSSSMASASRPPTSCSRCFARRSASALHLLRCQLTVKSARVNPAGIVP